MIDNSTNQSAMRSVTRPLKRIHNLRLLDEQTRILCAVELAERRKTNPELSINQFFNDLIRDALAVSHHPKEAQS